MKLLELLPDLKTYTRIKRKGWIYPLIKPEYNHHPFIRLNILGIELTKYMLTYEDLMADDWEIVHD